MKLNYRVTGEGKPLLILHGLFGSRDNWYGWASKLKGYEAFCLDLRNHGDSPWAEEMNFPVMAQDIWEFLETQGLETVKVLGHSMGAKVAMEAALRFPERFTRLAVVDMAPKTYPPRYEVFIRAMLSLPLRDLPDRKSVQEALERQLPIDRPTLQFLLKSLTEVPEGGFRWKIHLQSLLDNWEPLWAALDAGRSSPLPTLFAYGGKSDFFLPEDRDLCVKLFPHSRFLEIEGAGHWVHADKPLELLQAVQEHLDG